jgi:hypothetical protein
MAKKKQEPIAPAISTIPLSDQDTPLVIDLPDGQKLVVGNIPRGTVIEVATWRGTGRPDSRTNRLMLGVSSAESSPAPSHSAPEKTTESVTKSNPISLRFKKFFDSLVVKTPRAKREKAVAQIDELLASDVVTSHDDASTYSESGSKVGTRVSKALDDEGDIQSWLDDLMSTSTSEFLKSAEEPRRGTRSRPAKRVASAKRAKRARTKPRKSKTRAKKKVKKGR